MSAAAPRTPDQARAARQSVMFVELADMAMAQARCLHRQTLDAEAIATPVIANAADPIAASAAAAEVAATLTLAFVRAQRAVRQDLSLEDQMAARAQDRARRMAAEDRAEGAEQRLLARQRRSVVSLSTLALIDRPERPAIERERLTDELEMWLEAAPEEDLAELTTGQILEQVCKDLRLPLDFVFRNAQDASGEQTVAEALVTHRQAASPTCRRRASPPPEPVGEEPDEHHAPRVLPPPLTEDQWFEKWTP